MSTVEISDESLAFVRQLMTTIDEQDNLGTARPYFYVVQEKIEVRLPDGEGDDHKYLDYADGDYVTWTEADILSELVPAFKHKFDPDIWDNLDDGDKIQEVANANNFERYDFKMKWVEPERHNVFFTKAAIDKYIANNRYHWSGEVRTFLRHAWRNPEVAGIFKALAELAHGET